MSSDENIRLIEKTREIFNAGEIDRLIDECYHPQAEYVDHRAMAWEPAVGREAIRALFKSFFGSLASIRREFTVVATDEDRIVISGRVHGTAREDAGGGEFEYVDGEVIRIRGGRIWRRDLFSTPDEALAWAGLEPDAGPA